ncbi:protein FAM240B-like [Anomaloglossus baeobatrachus]|uniref:protein FAM240B-like n=1 Tax=Anomaloglossus baeobatrachus TaxID=238106 RepID=UPI003F4F3F88
MEGKTILSRRQILAHDADGLKNFWEKKIEKQTMDHQIEDARRHKSALSKLREEWTQRLQFRLNMLQSLQEEQKRQLYGKEPGSNPNTAA